MKPLITKIAFLNFILISFLSTMEQGPKTITWHTFQKAVRNNNVHIFNQYLENKKPNPKKLWKQSTQQ